MEISPILLAELLFFSFLFGILLGAVNDVNRIIRVFWGQKYSKRDFASLYSFFKVDREALLRPNEDIKSSTLKNVLIFLQDILFMIISAFGIVMLNYEFNDGKFRLFGPFAVLCGFLLYFFTVGKLIMAVSEPIAIIFRILIGKFLKIIITPIRIASHLISKITGKILNLIKKELEKRENMRYNKIRSREVLAFANIGFVNKLPDENIDQEAEYEG